jgi:S-formylglutathione hydrolase FrmB
VIDPKKMAQLKQLSSAKCCGGLVQRFQHYSDALSCEMKFSVFLPPQAQEGQKVPVHNTRCPLFSKARLRFRVPH